MEYTAYSVFLCLIQLLFSNTISGLIENETTSFSFPPFHEDNFTFSRRQFVNISSEIDFHESGNSSIILKRHLDLSNGASFLIRFNFTSSNQAEKKIAFISPSDSANLSNERADQLCNSVFNMTNSLLSFAITDSLLSSDTNRANWIICIDYKNSTQQLNFSVSGSNFSCLIHVKMRKLFPNAYLGFTHFGQKQQRILSSSNTPDPGPGSFGPQIPNSPTPSPTDSPAPSPNGPAPSPYGETNARNKRTEQILVGTIAGILGMLLLIYAMCYLIKKRKDRSKKRPLPDYRQFTYKELKLATNNFNKNEILGEGGYGCVFKGFIQGGEPVAVKRIIKKCKQSAKYMMAEADIMGRLNNPNLVQLKGWCYHSGALLLVYEYLQNGSLDDHLFREEINLPWHTRYNILKGLASAILYLHEGTELKIIHRDIKASNIMLDVNFNTKLGDFGLARIAQLDESKQQSSLVGTPGYLAPELLKSFKATAASDVYSFGVLALEVACGKRAIHFTSSRQEALISRVRKLYTDGNLLAAADSKLQGVYDEEEMRIVLVLGIACSLAKPESRPSMQKVFAWLHKEEQLPEEVICLNLLSEW